MRNTLYGLARCFNHDPYSRGHTTRKWEFPPTNDMVGSTYQQSCLYTGMSSSQRPSRNSARMYWPDINRAECVFDRTRLGWNLRTSNHSIRRVNLSICSLSQPPSLQSRWLRILKTTLLLTPHSWNRPAFPTEIAPINLLVSTRKISYQIPHTHSLFKLSKIIDVTRPHNQYHKTKSIHSATISFFN